VHIDAYGNPQVSYMEYTQGGIHIPLQLTDGGATTGRYYSLIDLSETGKKLVYPSLYFFPAISTVTPTAKVNLMSLRDVRFYVTVSYIGGYDVVPADIEMAANILTAGICSFRDNPSLANSISQGTFSVTYRKGTGASQVRGMDPFIERANEILQPYVRVTW
jgi:hypothetical protein